MDFELLPTVSLRSRSFNALTAPREMFIQALNRNLNLQRFKVLYVPGIDPFFEDLVQNADRVFYFEEGPRETPRLVAKAHPRARENQRTLEAYS